jgi:hypothetical protein
MRRLKPEVDQGVQIAGCHEVDVTAFAPVAAVGTTERYVLFATEADAAVAAVAGFDADANFVNEFHGATWKSPGVGASAGVKRGRIRCAAAGAAHASDGLSGDHADEFALFGTAYPEHDVTVGGREDRMISAQSDVLPGMETRSALPNDDVTGADEFAAVTLDPQPLRL